MKKVIVGIVVVAAFILQNASAILITTGGDPANTNAFVAYSHDVTFTIESATTFFLFAVDDAVAVADSSRTFLNFGGLNFSINGGSPTNFSAWADNLASNVGDLTTRDSYFQPAAMPALSIGDSVTIHAGTGTVTQASSDFQLFPTGNYSMYMCDGSGSRISDIVSIPEPTTLVFIGIFGSVLIGLRRTFLYW
ncbi:MAG: hypothetical protein K9M45_08190 [Kiritimatiellales bacterium]|nr:hypothetical protein [Kiritimatiellales bacterium]